MGLADELDPEPTGASAGAESLALSLSERLALDQNDAGNAARILAAHGEDMIFVTGKGWGIWDGARYSFRSGELRAREIGFRLQALVEEEARAAAGVEPSEIEVAARIRVEVAKDKPKFGDPETAARVLRSERRAALEKHAIKCGNVAKVKAALEAAQPRVMADIEDLDRDPWSFVVANGRVDLRAVYAARDRLCLVPEEDVEARAAWLKPHDRAARPTKASGVTYDPAAKCPAWEAFVALIMPDPGVRACLHRALGAALFGRNDSQCALLFRGGGGNGKSTLVNALQHVLGERDGYAAPCKIEMFIATQNTTAGQATPEEVDLPGARAYIASEPSARDELSAKKIKALTGGDLRPARALGMPQFLYRPAGLPILSFNRTPRIKDEDEGTRRRLVFFPFEVNLRDLPPELRRSSTAVESELRAEAPGILNWLLDGFVEWRKRLDAGQGKPPGIDPPAIMVELKDSLMESADPVGEFIKDCCVRDPSRWIRTQEFIRVYEAWCERTGSVQFKPSTVREVMTEKGVPKRKKGGGYESFLGLDWIAGPEMDSLLNAAGWGPEIVR